MAQWHKWMFPSQMRVKFGPTSFGVCAGSLQSTRPLLVVRMNSSLIWIRALQSEAGQKFGSRSCSTGLTGFSIFDFFNYPGPNPQMTIISCHIKSIYFIHSIKASTKLTISIHNFKQSKSHKILNTSRCLKFLRPLSTLYLDTQP